MVIRIQAILCFTVLFVTFIEARWHNFKSSQENRRSSAIDLTTLIKQQQQREQEEKADLSKSFEKYIRRRRHNPTIEGLNDDGSIEIEDYHQQQQRTSQEDDDSEEFDRPPARHRLLFQRKNHDRVQRLRHHHQRHDSTLDLIARENQRDYQEEENIEQIIRGKRHNRKRTWTEKDRKSFNSSRSRPLQFDENDKEVYEMEVREAQNSSLCNYTVIPIPDPGGRIPRELEHVKCNHVGSKCQDKGTYCCIQTYRNVQVLYENGKEETLKIYSGCVCSLQIYGTLEPYTPNVNIND